VLKQDILDCSTTQPLREHGCVVFHVCTAHDTRHQCLLLGSRRSPKI
jgi:hypothetical protein